MTEGTDALEASSPRLVVMASGRGSNFRALLSAIDEGRLRARITALISDRPDAPALGYARERGIRTYAWDYRAMGDPAAFYRNVEEAIDAERPRLIVLAGYMRILPASLVAKYRWRIVNIHPSLLPAFPGLHAQRQALEYGVRIAGCTVHFVDEGVDSGPVVAQAAVPVYDDDTEASLSDRILEQEHRIYPRAIERLLHTRYEIVGRRVRFVGGEDEPDGIVPVGGD